MRRIHVEAFKMAPKKAKSIEEGDRAFSWTDDELSLLLKVIIDYKAYQASNGKLLKGNVKTSLKNFSKDILPRFSMDIKSHLEDGQLP